MLDRWVNFLKKAEQYSVNTIPEELSNVGTIKKAMKVLDEMSLSEEEREDYEARLKWLRDEAAAIKKAEEKGREEGIEQGMKQGKQEEKLEIAKNLFASNVFIDVIQLATGLSVEELEKIKKEL